MPVLRCVSDCLINLAARAVREATTPLMVIAVEEHP
jgi:hypothetical protein